jgi:hypothetical protein
MHTLVYFASGPIRKEYQDLDFDRIYLVDNCFKRRHSENHIFSVGKVICIGMDCLESIKYLIKEDVHIDCFVSLNEGLSEGGGSYALNSDMFLGYAMPLLKDEYIHIMNKNYYQNMYHVSMDLPFDMEEIKEDDIRYLSPFIFSKDNYHKGHAKVYQMIKSQNEQLYNFSSNIKLTIIHDSIWNYYETLDFVVISFSYPGQQDFFEKLPKVVTMNNKSIDEIFTECVQKKICKIGFTPWAGGNYLGLIKKIENYKDDYPTEIKLFHLNKNDYRLFKSQLAVYY